MFVSPVGGIFDRYYQEYRPSNKEIAFRSIYPIFENSSIIQKEFPYLWKILKTQHLDRFDYDESLNSAISIEEEISQLFSRDLSSYDIVIRDQKVFDTLVELRNQLDKSYLFSLILNPDELSTFFSDQIHNSTYRDMFTTWLSGLKSLMEDTLLSQVDRVKVVIPQDAKSRLNEQLNSFPCTDLLSLVDILLINLSQYPNIEFAHRDEYIANLKRDSKQFILYFSQVVSSFIKPVVSDLVKLSLEISSKGQAIVLDPFEVLDEPNDMMVYVVSISEQKKDLLGKFDSFFSQENPPLIDLIELLYSFQNILFWSDPYQISQYDQIVNSMLPLHFEEHDNLSLDSFSVSSHVDHLNKIKEYREKIAHNISYYSQNPMNRV